MIRAKTCFLAEGVTTDRDTGQVFTASLSGTILTEFVGGLTEVYQRS